MGSLSQASYTPVSIPATALGPEVESAPRPPPCPRSGPGPPERTPSRPGSARPSAFQRVQAPAALTPPRGARSCAGKPTPAGPDLRGDGDLREEVITPADDT